MIVKVQIPIDPPDAPALLYDQSQMFWGYMDVEKLPAEVVKAASSGKAYFYVQKVGESIAFGAQAPAQEW